MRAEDGRTSEKDRRARAACLLSIALRRVPAPSLLENLEKALRSWHDNDKGLAYIRLAQIPACRLESEDDAWRLFLADVLLDAGLTPDDLLRELTDDATGLAKDFDPGQPRNPAGSGRESGRWASPSSGAKVALMPPVGLLRPLSPSAIGWLARLAARLPGPLAFFGAMVIPSPNPGVANEGTLPDHPDIAYRIDHDDGTLRLTSKGDSDPEDAIVALLGHDGFYRQVESGEAIGRVLPNGAVIIDLGDDKAAEPDAREEPGGSGWPTPTPPRPPKLCPDPGPDSGRHYGFSATYELYVRDHVNPQRIPQLPVGLTFALPSDGKRGWTYYDDCQESTGKMIEAKSDESAYMLSRKGRYFVERRFRIQAENQVRASQGRPVEWYFHWKKAALIAEALFKDGNIPIKIHYLPYPGRPSRR